MSYTDDPERRPIVQMCAVLAVAVLLVGAMLMFSTSSVRAVDDYVFGSEDVTTGRSVDSANRDAEDGAFQQLVEEDTYSDTNYSGSSENVVTGTAGGGAFSSSLDSDDDTRRSYTEANTGSAPPEPYTVYLMPNGDSSVGWDTVYPSDGVHYTKVDDSTVGGDGSSTYVMTGTDADEDRFNLEDMSDPGAGYDINVTLFAVHQKDSNQGANFQAGIRIGTTNYIVIDTNPSNGAWTNESGAIWLVNPSTTAEWTYSEVNDLLAVITTSDANPNIYCTQVGIKVDVTFSGGSTNYELDAQVTFSDVAGSSQATGYKVFCQGYRTDASEDFGVYAWDYVATDWNLKDTVDQGSDFDFDFALTSDERDGTGNEVKLRILGLTESGDTTQNIVYLDVLKVSRIEEGYALDISMTASSVPQYGNVTLRIKGYTDPGETFDVSIWNYTASDWDADVLSLSDTTNTLNTYDLVEEHHRSGTEVKIRWEDATAAASDTTQDTYYLDLAVVTHYHTDPAITLYGDDGPVNYGSTVHFWLNYTDEDNEAPEYVRVVISATPYDMTKNETDTSYWDGCNYSYSTDALAGGEHSYYFAVKDAGSDEVTTGADTVTINRAPTLGSGDVEPDTGNNGQTFTFTVQYTDADGDLPDYIQAVIDSTPYDMDESDAGDADTTDGKWYTYDKAMAGGSHSYYFQTADYMSSQVTTASQDLEVNNIPTLGSYIREPAGTVYPTTLVYFNVTFTDLDGDLPSVIKWRENGGAAQNLTMSQVDAGDSDTTDGKDYTVSLYLSHGSHDYDFYASDGMGSVSGGDDSVTIDNRAPTIDNDPGSPETYRSTYWSFDFAATDLDDDTVGWEMSTNCTELSIAPSSGLVEGTMSSSLAWYDVTVWANDSYSGSDSLNFQLSVVNRVPTITSSGNTTQALGTYMAYHVTYTDADSDEIILELSTNCTDLALANEWVNGTVSSAGWYWCKLWANDSYGGSDLEEWTLTVSNEAPYFTSTAITTATNGTAYSYDANASDPNPGTELEYGLTTNCTDLSVHTTLGFVNGTLSLVGTYYVNVTASDGLLVAYQNYSLEVQNIPPAIITEPVENGNNGEQYSYEAEAEDPNGDTLEWAIESGPSWLFIDEDTGELGGTPTTPGEFLVNISVFDGYDYDYQEFTLTVEGDEEPEEPAEPGEHEGGGYVEVYAPDARFEYIIRGNKLIVMSESTGTISSYQWSFGDGTGSNLAMAEHVYTSEGTYHVKLTVFGPTGLADSAETDITISYTPDLLFQKGEVGYDVYIQGEKSFTIPVWALAVAGVGLLVSLKLQREPVLRVMTYRVRLIIGLACVVACGVYYGVF